MTERLTVYNVRVEHYIPGFNPPEEWYLASNAQEQEIADREMKRESKPKSVKVTAVGSLEMRLEDLIPSQCGHGDVKVWIKGFEKMVEYNKEGVLVPK